jgi:hypothetical protein
MRQDYGEPPDHPKPPPPAQPGDSHDAGADGDAEGP